MEAEAEAEAEVEAEAVETEWSSTTSIFLLLESNKDVHSC